MDNRDSQPAAEPDRESLETQKWFRETGKLAIADCVWVENVGVCSYQPIVAAPEGFYTMLSAEGRIYMVPRDQLFMTTEEERDAYWLAQKTLTKTLRAK